MHVIEFDITDREVFGRVGRNFGYALHLFEPEARRPILYYDKILYHPFLIAIDGPRAGGKSSFIKEAVEGYAEQAKTRGLILTLPIEKLWPSSEEDRDIKIWMRWPFNGPQGDMFEIRSDDRLALDSLYGLGLVGGLPSIEIPNIYFREWPDENFHENARVKIEIEYENKRRLLKISIDPALEVDRILEILHTKADVSAAPCLTSSTITANELVPAF